MHIKFSSSNLARGEICTIDLPASTPTIQVIKSGPKPEIESLPPAQTIFPWEFYVTAQGDTPEEILQSIYNQECQIKQNLITSCKEQGWENIHLVQRVRKDIEIQSIKPIDPILLGCPAGTVIDESKYPNYYGSRIIALAAFPESPKEP